MSNDVTKVTVGKPQAGGAIFRGPIGVQLPTSATEGLAEQLVNLGYCNEDGLTNSQSMTTGDIKAWGGDVVDSPLTEHADTFQFKLIQSLDPEVLKTVYNSDNVTGDLANGLTVRVNSTDHENYSWVIDMLMKNGLLKRIVIPNAKITALADIVYKDDTVVAYDVTLTAFSDSTGTKHYEYLSEPVASGE